MGMHEFDRAIADWALALQWPLDGLLRLALAAVCGGVVGIEREVSGRQAGFRTNMLVCLGSAIVMVVSMQFASHQFRFDPEDGLHVTVDPARIAYGVMTGIGFLGAGTIIKNDRGPIRGLTTAAGLWCVAGIGLAAGFGLYLFTILATVMVFVCLWALHHVEDYFPRRHFRFIAVRRRWEPDAVAATVAYLKARAMTVNDVAFVRSNDLKDVDVRVEIAFGDPDAFYKLERELAQEEALTLLEMRGV